MAAGDKSHLIERAAERLIKAGGAPSGLGFNGAGPAPFPPEAAGTGGAAPGPVAVDPLAVDPLAADPLAVDPLAAPLASAPSASRPPLPLPPQVPSPPARLPGEPPQRPAAFPGPGVAMPPRHRVDRERLLAAGLAEEGGGHSRIAEEFRLVQQQVLRGAFGAELESGLANLVMVTSARPNEGKTFTAINLAFSIARRGDHKVLLVDADAKHGSLSDLLGIGDEPGLLDLAADPSMDAGPCLVGSPMESLSILPIGYQRARRGDVFASNNMMRVIQELGRRYADRLVVIDVAPCLSTSDPAMLAGVVGQVLFVVEAESTQRDEVEAALDLIQTCPTITLLLNKVQMSTSRSFGAYSYSYTS